MVTIEVTALVKARGIAVGPGRRVVTEDALRDLMRQPNAGRSIRIVPSEVTEAEVSEVAEALGEPEPAPRPRGRRTGKRSA